MNQRLSRWLLFGALLLWQQAASGQETTSRIRGMTMLAHVKVSQERGDWRNSLIPSFPADDANAQKSWRARYLCP